MIGQTIQNYKITSKIGEGGMGIVYLGEDVMLERKVAIKILRSHLLHDADLLNRFQSEAKILSRLNHLHIAGLYNFFQYENTYCMVMEYVDGEPLDELLQRHRRIPEEVAVNLISQALEGLAHAHRKKVIHRDIKLSNLILSKDNIIKIMDFGIARAVGSSRLTSTGRAVGTLAYMSPEQIRGKEGDEKSDLYAMGVVLYELLTGVTPFREETEFDLMRAHLEQAPPPPREKIETLSPGLEAVVLRALEKDPDQRYPDARAFQSALRAAIPVAHGGAEGAGAPTREIDAATRLIDTLPAPAEKKGTGPAAVLAGLQEKWNALTGWSEAGTTKKVFFGAVSLALLIVMISLISLAGPDKQNNLGVVNPKENTPTEEEETYIDGTLSLVEPERPVPDPDPVVRPTEDQVTNQPPRREPSSTPATERPGSTQKQNKPSTPDKQPAENPAPNPKEPFPATEKPDPPAEKRVLTGNYLEVKETPIAYNLRKNNPKVLCTLPSRTPIRLSLLDDVLFNGALKEDDWVRFRVIRGVAFEGYKIIEEGAVIKGRIDKISEPDEKGNAKIVIEFDWIMTVAKQALKTANHKSGKIEVESELRKGDEFVVNLKALQLIYK